MIDENDDSQSTDYQGINWKLILPGRSNPRNLYRNMRNHKYKPYRSIPTATNFDPTKKAELTETPFVDFKRFHSIDNIPIGHFQLRYNLQALSHFEIMTFVSNKHQNFDVLYLNIKSLVNSFVF